MNLEEIKVRYPSICYDCKNARKPASDANILKGYVGCCLRVISNPLKIDRSYDFDEIIEAKEVAEGWVDLRSEIKLGKGTGVISNLMLLTLEVKQCKSYKQNE